LQGLLDVLSPDVVLLTDAGGRKTAALRPISGRDKVLRFLSAVTPADSSVEPTVVNGAPGLRIRVGGEVDGVLSLAGAGRDGDRPVHRPQPAEAGPTGRGRAPRPLNSRIHR
ncbi:MAG: hypothetical protein M3P91_05780, partial [Actinomycetota bacterium]|nr:hypothetical protein [Actinomycetota bacterium]